MQEQTQPDVGLTLAAELVAEVERFLRGQG